MAIRKVKSGFQIDYWPTGRRGCRVRETFPTRQEARDALAKARIVRRPTQPGDTVSVSLCVSEWLHYINAFRAPKYHTRCLCSARTLLNWFDSNGISAVNQLNMRRMDAFFVFRKNHGAATQTIINDVRAIHAALEWSRSRSIIHENPISHYKPPERPVHKTPQVPTPSQIQEIFDHLPDNPTREILYFILSHGSRFTETASLLSSDIQNGTVTFSKNVKRHQNRIVTLAKLPFPLNATSNHLFEFNSKQWLERNLLYRLQTACILAQVPKINIHTLRHARATYSLAMGGPDNTPYLLMNRCGWRTMAMLDQYATISIKYAGHPYYLPTWRWSSIHNNVIKSENGQNPQPVDTQINYAIS